MSTESPAGDARPRSSQGWLMALGCLLAVVGVLREPAHSLQPAQPRQDDGQTPTTTQIAPLTHPGGNADSNSRMIAVTGTDLTGSSVLFVIDTLEPHIAVYQATGGSPSMQSIKLVAARRIDLDLQLDGFNDDSQHTYKDLHQDFAEAGLISEDD